MTLFSPQPSSFLVFHLISQTSGQYPKDAFISSLSTPNLISAPLLWSLLALSGIPSALPIPQPVPSFSLVLTLLAAALKIPWAFCPLSTLLIHPTYRKHLLTLFFPPHFPTSGIPGLNSRSLILLSHSLCTLTSDYPTCGTEDILW